MYFIIIDIMRKVLYIFSNGGFVMEKDYLDGWRESTRKYEGDCEYDATAEAIKAYLKEQELKEQAKKEEENQKTF